MVKHSSRISPRRGPSKRHAKRLKIKHFWEQGYGIMDIARQVPCTKKCARLWVGRFEEAKEQELSDEEVVLSQPRTGRPPTVTPGVKKLILEYCKGKRKRSLRKCSKWLRGKGIKVRKDTVRKHLVQSGLYPYRRQKQPFLN